MRTISLSHIVLASLFWCAAVFVFVGMHFMKYEAASRMLRETRIETAVKNLGTRLQFEMDKGEKLSALKNAEMLMRQSAADDPDMISALIFDAKHGTILFSSSDKKTEAAIDLWKKKCVSPDVVFTEKDKNGEIFGLSLQNAFSENSGCLIVRYSTKSYELIREEMIKTAFRYTFRLSFVGVLICFVVYFYSILLSSVFTDKKIRLTAVLFFLTSILFVVLYFNFTTMFDSFETDIKKGISDKARLVSKQIADQINRVVQNGVPLDSVTALEVYMDGVRQKNKEILFVLVTDKTGRVLYESGSAANAFESDALTGKISLRKGYYSAASAVNADGAVAGWVQIGVNERFVREKNL